MRTFDFEGIRLEELEERSIFNLMTEEEISKKEISDQNWLNEGSADVEDLDALMEQAKAYFSSPNYYPVNEEGASEFVTGFISIYNGESHSPRGVEVIWKSTRESIRLDVSKLNADVVIEELSKLGIQFSDLIRVVFYGPALRKHVGSAIYEKGQRKDLIPIDDCHSTIMLAVPDHAEVCLLDDNSIYSALNSLVKEEVKYGKLPCEALDRYSFTHWSLTKEFYESRSKAIKEEAELAVHNRKVESLKTKKSSMNEHFQDAVEAIDHLNAGILSISDVSDKCDAHYVNKILYVARSNVFKQRISNKFTYFQLVALSKKLMNNDQLQAA